VLKADNLPPSCAVVTKSGSLNFLEPSGPSQACNGTALPLYIYICILLIKRYKLYKVLACSTTFFQLSLFCATFFQLHTFMLFISYKTSSSQRVLDLPIGLLDMCFHLFIFCTLSSAMRSTWTSQFSLCFLINPIIFCPYIYIYIYIYREREREREREI